MTINFSSFYICTCWYSICWRRWNLFMLLLVDIARNLFYITITALSFCSSYRFQYYSKHGTLQTMKNVGKVCCWLKNALMEFSMQFHNHLLHWNFTLQYPVKSFCSWKIIYMIATKTFGLYKKFQMAISCCMQIISLDRTKMKFWHWYIFLKHRYELFWCSSKNIM